MRPNPPWHSGKESVHHTHRECKAGEAIRVEHIRYGEGGKPQCAECARLEAAEEPRTTKANRLQQGVGTQ
jgi:hypothetical protein